MSRAKAKGGSPKGAQNSSCSSTLGASRRAPRRKEAAAAPSEAYHGPSANDFIIHSSYASLSFFLSILSQSLFVFLGKRKIKK